MTERPTPLGPYHKACRCCGHIDGAHLKDCEIDNLQRDRSELMEMLREAIPMIGRFDFTPMRCPNCERSSIGPALSGAGFTINDNHETGMVRCHTCGHRWQSIKPNEIADQARALLARLEK